LKKDDGVAELTGNQKDFLRGWARWLVPKSLSVSKKLGVGKVISGRKS
jgi:hypothetical protein